MNTAPPASRRTHGETKRKLTGTLLLAVVMLGWFLWLRPASLGGPVTFVRVTGVSMEPGMSTGDLAVVRADGSYDVGEVVAFRVPQEQGEPGPYVIHRITDRHAGELTLRGDNNDHDDPWTVRDQDVAGKLWLHVPGAGSVIARVADPVVLAALAASVTVFLVMVGSPTDAPRTGGARSPSSQERFEPHESSAR